MFQSRRAPSSRLRRSQSTSVRSAGVLTLATALAAALAVTAFATTTLTIGSAANSTVGKQVVINPQGRTLYTLSPETSSHLLCKSSECLKRWPPLTVRSKGTKLKAGSGLHGRLGILKRANGTLQVTLRGLPLYRYAADHAKGDANGDGIESFGGTWHVATASSGSGTTAPPMTPSPPTTTPPYPYQY